MISGLHAPNATWSGEDRCRLRVSGLQAVELMSAHTTEADVVQLRALGVSYFLMRLPDSVDASGRFKGDVEYASECIALIRRFYPLGVRDYQLDNECNLTWPLDKASWWRWLIDRVVRGIRANIPTDVRLGLTPLAWKPDTWATVEGVWIPEQRLILDLFDFVCVHSYWQKGAYYNHPPFGGNVTHWHDVLLGPSKPYVITEWASSVHETGLPANDVEALRLMQYPQWLQWVSTKPYVESAFLYILGGTEHWEGFHPTDPVLRAMAQAA